MRCFGIILIIFTVLSCLIVGVIGGSIGKFTPKDIAIGSLVAILLILGIVKLATWKASKIN